MNKNFVIVACFLLAIFIHMIGAVNSVFPYINKGFVFIFGALFVIMLVAAYNPANDFYRKLKAYFFIILSIGLALTSFFIGKPGILNQEEKEYMKHLDAGYKCYQNDNYDCAIKEYELAEFMFDNDPVLYYYKALSYKYLKDYEKAIEQAQKALNYNEKDSIYNKAKGFGLIKHDIGIYDVIGDCYFELKNYYEAKEAYSYIVNHTSYKYSDVYIYRGICEYYLGEKENALNDFNKHKQVIYTYIEDQANSEYKHPNPTYKQKDIDLVNGWIDSAKNL